MVLSRAITKVESAKLLSQQPKMHEWLKAIVIEKCGTQIPHNIEWQLYPGLDMMINLPHLKKLTFRLNDVLIPSPGMNEVVVESQQMREPDPIERHLRPHPSVRYIDTHQKATMQVQLALPTDHPTLVVVEVTGKVEAFKDFQSTTPMEFKQIYRKRAGQPARSSSPMLLIRATGRRGWRHCVGLLGQVRRRW